MGKWGLTLLLALAEERNQELERKGMPGREKLNELLRGRVRELGSRNWLESDLMA